MDFAITLDYAPSTNWPMEKSASAPKNYLLVIAATT
jgi:hypothetical protein